MLKTFSFNEHVAEYEAWFQKYPFVFRSEVEAIRELLPRGENLNGLEIAAGTGRFSEALGISEGIEPAGNMRSLALKRGINVQDAVAERLPYHDLHFDFVLMVFAISYFKNLHLAFKEANRVLKNKGSIIAGFIDKDSMIGKDYEARRAKSVFYKQAVFYSPEKVARELKEAGFNNIHFSQTLFHHLDDIKDLEPARQGYGEGSFVLIKAIKK